MVERRTQWKLISLALLVTVVAIGSIYWIGMKINEFKVNDLRNEINEIEAEQRSQRIGFELSSTFEEDNCRAQRKWRRNSLENIRNLRNEVQIYENARKFDNPDYRVAKKRYMNLLMQNMLELRRIEDRCNENFTEIIYLYSNEDCDACEDQGTVLNYIRRQNPEKVVVHPLDTDLGMDSIEFIENYYNVTRYPAVVVEGERYQGFQSRQRLEEILTGNNLTSDRR